MVFMQQDNLPIRTDKPEVRPVDLQHHRSVVIVHIDLIPVFRGRVLLLAASGFVSGTGRSLNVGFIFIFWP